jgi:hypothetical protein
MIGKGREIGHFQIYYINQNFLKYYFTLNKQTYICHVF